MQKLFWIIQPSYINKQHHQGIVCVCFKGHLSWCNIIGENCSNILFKRVRSISPTIFEVDILNLVCACILGWRIVLYRLGVTVSLVFDLISRIIVSGAYHLHYLR